MLHCLIKRFSLEGGINLSKLKRLIMFPCDALANFRIAVPHLGAVH